MVKKHVLYSHLNLQNENVIFPRENHKIEEQNVVVLRKNCYQIRNRQSKIIRGQLKIIKPHL